MSAKRTQSPAIRLVIFAVALVFVVWSLYQDRKANTQVGQLEFRMLTGEKEGKFQIIMMETADRFFVLDSAFRTVFDQNDAEVISRPEQIQLFGAYNDLQYRLGMDIAVTGQKGQFRVNREGFNQVDFNKTIEFKLDRKIKDSISQIAIQ